MAAPSPLEMPPDLAEALDRLMRLRRRPTPAAALRVAVTEALEQTPRDAGGADFRTWVGAGNRGPRNPRPRFPTDDALWER